MQWHLALHMNEDIALNGCECMVGKSILCLVFDWVGSVNGTTSKMSHGRIKEKGNEKYVYSA